MIKYPEDKSPNISDREKVMVRDKEGGICRSKCLRRSGMMRSRV